MAKVAPEDKFAGLADAALLAQTVPSSICSILNCRRSPCLRRARARRGGGVCGQGRQQIGGRIRIGQHRRDGAGDQPRFSRRLSRLTARLSMSAIAGEGTAMETDYDYSRALHAADLKRRKRSGGVPASARWRGSIRARSRPQGAGGLRQAGGELAGRRISPARSTARRSRARPASSGTSSASGCSLPGIRIIDDPLRKRGPALASVRWRGRRRQAARADRDGVLVRGCSTARPRASWGSSPPATRSAVSRRRHRPGRPICISKPGDEPGGADRRYR